MLKNLLSLFAVALLWLLHLLPLAVLASLGSGLGRLLFLFGRERRKIVQINLGLCFPELDERAQNQLALAHFQVLGRSLLERSLLWWSPQKRVDRLIQVDGAEKISALLQAGKPVILLAPHFVGLDAGGVGIAMRFDSVSLYAEQSSPVFDHLLLKGRKRFGNQLLLSRQDGIRASIKAMKSGRPFYYLPDVSGRRRDSVFVPFFGVPTATVSAIPRLARATGAVLVPCITRMLPGGQGYRVEIGTPWTDYPSDDLTVDVARINACIEAAVRTMPEQYLWVHRRFKKQPHGTKAPY